jgi:hypothetical protein
MAVAAAAVAAHAVASESVFKKKFRRLCQCLVTRLTLLFTGKLTCGPFRGPFEIPHLLQVPEHLNFRLPSRRPPAAASLS